MTVFANGNFGKGFLFGLFPVDVPITVGADLNVESCRCRDALVFIAYVPVAGCFAVFAFTDAGSFTLDAQDEVPSAALLLVDVT